MDEPQTLSVLKSIDSTLAKILQRLDAQVEQGLLYARTIPVTNQSRPYPFGAPLFSFVLINDGPNPVIYQVPVGNAQQGSIQPGEAFPFTTKEASLTGVNLVVDVQNAVPPLISSVRIVGLR